MATQQADSLVGMLGWYPDWMRKEHPKNEKVRDKKKRKKKSDILENPQSVCCLWRL